MEEKIYVPRIARDASNPGSKIKDVRGDDIWDASMEGEQQHNRAK